MAQDFLELLIKTVGNAEALDIIDKFQQVIMFSRIIKCYQYLFPHFFFQTLDCLLYCSLLFLLKLKAANQREGEIYKLDHKHTHMNWLLAFILIYLGSHTTEPTSRFTKESLNSFIILIIPDLIYPCEHHCPCMNFPG
ncbi:hypothetical protein Hanom_Chr01g00040341 [Helianthus anomalus]